MLGESELDVSSGSDGGFDCFGGVELLGVGFGAAAELVGGVVEGFFVEDSVGSRDLEVPSVRREGVGLFSEG